MVSTPAPNRRVTATTDRVMSVMQEFKAFILRGSVVDLAIAVVVGAAFSGIVDALVKDLVTPLIAAIVGQPDFSQIKFTINRSQFLIGDFINAVVNFLLIAAVIFFFVVKPLNALLALRRTEEEAPPEVTNRDCPYCLSVIPTKATRCRFCTAEVAAIA